MFESFKNLGVLSELGGKNQHRGSRRGISTTEITEGTEGKLLLKNQISKRSIQERLGALGVLGGKTFSTEDSEGNIHHRGRREMVYEESVVKSIHNREGENV